MLSDVSHIISLVETPQHQEESFASAVSAGLSQRQKTLPCRFFYDKLGSELFEQICVLPEYYPTRTERGILERHASDMIARAMTGNSRLALVEFGSGSSIKTRILIDAILTRQTTLHYTPIDISADFLLESARDLQNSYSQLSVTAIASEYQDALSHVPNHPEQSRLFLFLGSSIGNFDLAGAAAFLEQIGEHMDERDRLLIGFDRIKEKSILEAAYNDEAEVTAAFNKNLLTRINNELGGNFDLERFDHHAPFVNEQSRIEMRLISQRSQHVKIEALGQTFDFMPGEFIHTENSHKHSNDSITTLAEATGLKIESTWQDDRNWLSLVMFRKSNR